MKPARSAQTTAAILLSVLLLVASGAAAAALPDAVSDARAALASMATYEYGDSRVALTALREAVRAALTSESMRRGVESEVIGYLDSDATFAGKQFAAEQLSLIGSAAAVPALGRLLRGEETYDLAIFALQRIPAPEAEQALLSALTAVGRAPRIAIVNALGERGAATATTALVPMLSGDEAVASAAAAALGKIGGSESAAALEGALSSASGTLREIVLDSYLRCADGLLADGMAARAGAMYASVYQRQDSVPARAAALRGMVAADPRQAPQLLLSSLRRDTQALQTVAASLVRELPEDADLGAIFDEVPNLGALTQVQLLAAFARRGEKASHAAVLTAARHYDQAVRSAALAALVTVGSEADVERLADIAVSAMTEADRRSARAALDALPAAAATQAIMEQIPAADAGLRTELVRSLGARKAVAATDLLLAVAVDPEPGVRAEALRSLALVGEAEQLEALIGLLMAETDGAVRNEAERTVVLVAQKDDAAERPAAPVMTALETAAPGDARESLIEVLGRIGDLTALPFLRGELSSAREQDRLAAILALTAWPDAGPKEELLRIAQRSPSPVDKVLALRGYIQLLRIRSDRSDEESVALYRGAMELATETTERRMVLSGLGEVPSHHALREVTEHLDNETITLEAQAAAVQIIDEIRWQDDRFEEMIQAGVDKDLERILEAARDEQLIDGATMMLERLREVGD